MDIRLTHTGYYAQESGTCCFVIAVANFLKYQDAPVTLDQIREAITIAKCEHGSTINHTGVVQYFQAPLKETSSVQAVIDHGGITHIMHPIWNGHSIFVQPTNQDEIIVFNSWLGPNMCTIGKAELWKFIPAREIFGKNWVPEGV